MSIIKRGDLVLFQGDSITDCGRVGSPDELGSGYVSIIAGWLAASGGPDCRILNRGVGGDRSAELLARWKADCLDLRPDVLSIMVGVNDVWRIRGEWQGQGYIGPAEFEGNYARLIAEARGAGLRQLALMSPTTIEGEADAGLSALLDERALIVRRLAEANGAVYVPARESQKALLAGRPGVSWTSDGCHPTLAGHAALARAWLSAAGLA